MNILTLLAVRRAIVPMLASNAPVTASIPAARIYPEEVPVAPEWPFARVGTVQASPFAPSGVNGAVVTGTVAVFAKGPGADDAIKAGAAVGAALHLAVLDLSADIGRAALARVRVTGSPLVPDAAEKGAWQVAVQFAATVEVPA